MKKIAYIISVTMAHSCGNFNS